MTGSTTLMLIAALVVLAGASWMSYRGTVENLLSLTIGTVLSLSFGIAELTYVVGDGRSEDVQRIATSIAFTGSGALLARLVLRRLRGGRDRPAPSR
jgi:hypothetical protein